MAFHWTLVSSHRATKMGDFFSFDLLSTALRLDRGVRSAVIKYFF